MLNTENRARRFIALVNSIVNRNFWPARLSDLLSQFMDGKRRLAPQPVACPIHQRSPDGFTLVEMLVVIAIIGLLLGLLMPVLTSARNMARKADCQMRLRQIGIAMTNYVDAHGQSGKYPDVAQLPSLTPERPSLVSVLTPYVGETKQVFGCPMDTEYYPTEGISYEYRALEFGGKTMLQVLTSPFNNRKRVSSEVMMLHDYGPFHGGVNQAGARNVLYLDGHVEPL